MKSLIATNPGNYLALVARFAVAITIFPHGAQKVLGWFGWQGFSKAMYFFTEMKHLPYVIGLLFIIIEFSAPIFLLFGFLSRFAAFCILVIYSGAIVVNHAANGFFMNWGAEANKGEGWEYFILLFGLLFIILIAGGGKASIDSMITKRKSYL